MYCVYILFSAKLDRFYTGFTSDFDERMEFHNNPVARKFTAKADDWVLFDSIVCENKPQALSIEKHIKSMKSKTYIKNLKQYPEMKEKLKSKYKWPLIRAPIAIGVGSSPLPVPIPIGKGEQKAWQKCQAFLFLLFCVSVLIKITNDC